LKKVFLLHFLICFGKFDKKKLLKKVLIHSYKNDFNLKQPKIYLNNLVNLDSDNVRKNQDEVESQESQDERPVFHLVGQTSVLTEHEHPRVGPQLIGRVCSSHLFLLFPLLGGNQTPDEDYPDQDQDPGEEVAKTAGHGSVNPG
jgi:hypothetical protein